MDSMEIIEIKVDTTEVDTAMEDIHKGFSLILSLLAQTGAALIKVVNSLQGNLSVVEQSLHKISTTLEAVQLSFSAFTESYQAMNEDNQWAEDVIAGVETLCAIIGSITSVAAVLIAADISAATAIMSGGVVAAITIIIAAIIALVNLIVENWDEIKLFFTETLPQLWDQVVEWISGIGIIIADWWKRIMATLATVAQWVDENVLQPIGNFFSSAMEWIGTKVQEGVSFVQSIFGSITAFLQGVFAKDWTEQFGAFGNVLNAFFANVENIWNAVKSIFSGIVSFVKNIFAGDWSAAWDSIVSVFKGIWDYMLAVVKVPVNGIIGLINGLVEGVVGGINLVIKALNNISFDIPSWVPVIGGETFGFNLTTLTAPKIPLLAKGAVLPANRPFLAVVGDQRHGTNVEAPLTTIQEAVAVVLSQQLPALMAGFEAVVNEQRATREMIAQIQIGDDMIANAVHRFDRKMAVMRGL